MRYISHRCRALAFTVALIVLRFKFCWFAIFPIDSLESCSNWPWRALKDFYWLHHFQITCQFLFLQAKAFYKMCSVFKFNPTASQLGSKSWHGGCLLPFPFPHLWSHFCFDWNDTAIIYSWEVMGNATVTTLLVCYEMKIVQILLPYPVNQLLLSKYNAFWK